MPHARFTDAPGSGKTGGRLIQDVANYTGCSWLESYLTPGKQGSGQLAFTNRPVSGRIQGRISNRTFRINR
jgi:hypothetical protein